MNGIVVAPFALGTRHAAEFGRPDDERVVEHAAGLQILDQGRGRLIHAGPHVAVVLGDVFVAVPVAARKAVVGAAPNLHEPHAPLQQPAGEQAIAAKILGHFLVQAVAFAASPRSRAKCRAPPAR